MNCKQCNAPIPNKRIFCSKSCSATYNNTGRVRTQESREKTSKSLLNSGFKPKPPPSQRGRRWAKKPDETWLEYQNSCRFYTPYYLLPKIEGHELVKEYGWYHPKRNPIGASRDHMFSVHEGWKQKIPINIISHPANCKIILITDNKKKSSKCSITLDELHERIKKWSP